MINPSSTPFGLCGTVSEKGKCELKIEKAWQTMNSQKQFKTDTTATE